MKRPKALDEGILAGAVLDILEGEELLKDERQMLVPLLRINGGRCC